MRASRHPRVFQACVSLLALIGLALASCGQLGAPMASLTPTSPTAAACSQIQGFGDATPLNLPSMQFPAGTVAQIPITSDGGAGQYTIKTYQACAPNTDINLTVSTGKGPEPFTKLLQVYGWATWDKFPAGGNAQVACSGACFAFNAYDASKGLFQGPPSFLALSTVSMVGKGVVTFQLSLAAAPVAPDCSYMRSGGPSPLITTWYDQPGDIQFPPLTLSSPDDTMSTTGSVQCSPGTIASVKAFMDHQFAANGYVSDPCQAYDCWRKGSLVVSMQLTSATQWFIFVPRVLPTP